jgi:hypothetical protein
LLVWAKRATQVCSTWKLNQLAEHCAMFMDMEAFEQGDRSGEHLKARTVRTSAHLESFQQFILSPSLPSKRNFPSHRGQKNGPECRRTALSSSECGLLARMEHHRFDGRSPDANLTCSRILFPATSCQ